MIDPEIDSLLSSSQHTAIYLIQLAQTCLRILAPQETSIKGHRKLQTRYTYNPWLNADEKYAVGNVVKGKVARMTDFGAFIELEPGVDALLHVSQISQDHVEKPSDDLEIGQDVEAKIVDFNEEDKKISLSIKALTAPAVEDEEASENV